MRKKGKHLTQNDRLTIERMLLKNYNKKDIANAIGCCLATVYNEVRRATYMHTDSELKEEVRYNPDEAHRKYKQQLKQKGIKPKLLQDPRLMKYIEDMIVDFKYSPEAVLLKIREDNIVFDVNISSVNTVYKAIKKGYFESLSMEYLPNRKRTKRKKKVKIQKRAAKGTSIEKRNDEVLERKIIGNWEMDCVIGKLNNRKTILVLTERKTRYTILEVLKEHTASEVVKALNRIEKRYGSSFYRIFKTITVDNGSEFADYIGMEKSLYRVGNRTKVYYCHPAAPHERGSNEVGNRLIRRFYPKGSDFDKCLKRNGLKEVEYWINEYPRNIFSGQCSSDIFLRETKEILFAGTI